ncbi:Protein krueppel [Trichinella papuae]|uniref:Protein krueppel n=1 Tax=Trichinella papuae TaxID=268474 RepID=A0A0V1M9E8_9BILA|nr:Protein krueppel [Trichinella papuae]
MIKNICKENSAHASIENGANDFEKKRGASNNDQALVCEICKRRFGNAGAKANHMRMHCPEQPLVCPVCKKRFKWEICLKQHLKAHARQSHITENEANKNFVKVIKLHHQKKKERKLRDRRATHSTKFYETKSENCEHEDVCTVKVEETAINIDLKNESLTSVNDNINKNHSAPNIRRVRLGESSTLKNTVYNQSELKGQQTYQSSNLKDKFKNAQISMNQRFQKVKKVE